MEQLPVPNQLPHDEEFVIVELDDRFEFGVAVIDDSSYDNDIGCNGTGCKQNGYCPG